MTDEWTFVKTKKKNSREKVVNDKNDRDLKCLQISKAPIPDFAILLGKAMLKMRETELLQRLRQQLSRIDALPRCICCYGIGNFMLEKNALLQLALYLLIREMISQITNENVRSSSPNVAQLSDVDLPAVYFMPHCPYSLYCQTLWMHWERLSEISIIGNSFSSYDLRRIEGAEALSGDCVRILRPLVQEFPICFDDCSRESRRRFQAQCVDELFEMEYAFNDISWHVFSKDSILSHSEIIEAKKPSAEELKFLLDKDKELIAVRIDP